MLVEESKEITFSFANFNPPTISHEKLIDKVASIANGNNYKIFVLSPKTISSLDFNTKIKSIRKMFPKYGRAIMNDIEINSVYDILVKLNDQGYTKISLVIDSDRLDETQALINTYNFSCDIVLIPSGDKNPDETRRHIKLDIVSEDREKYIKGLLYSLNDSVIIKENKQDAKIIMLGANYVIVQTLDGTKHRKWLKDIKKLQDL